MAKELILSFNEKSIKASIVEKSGSKFDLINSGSVEINDGSIQSGAIKNYDEVKLKLGQLLGSVTEAKSHHINILLAEEGSFLKVIEAEKEKDLIEDPKVQESVPYPLKGSYTSLRLLKNKSIQLVASPQELISFYQKLFADLGLKINSIIPEPVVFLPFLEKSTKPALVISLEGASVLFSVVFDGGIYFSTTKHFKDGVFNKERLSSWIKELVEAEIKKLREGSAFEIFVFGEREEEILNIVKETGFTGSLLPVAFGKVNPQIGDFSAFKRLILATGLNKYIPGFHIREVYEHEPTKSKVIQTPILPKTSLRRLMPWAALVVIIITLALLTPKIFSLFSTPKGRDKQTLASPSVQPATASAIPSATPSATASATKEVPEATSSAKKEEEPKPVLKKSSLKVEALNGNGVPGSANEAADFLKLKGYNVISSGNAANYNFTKTEIRIKKSKLDYLPLLTKDLSTRYTVVIDAALAESSSADAQVIIGKQ
ncbi:MAG: LytR C-terminal domain-containing protein [Candidatus Woykebacteria bacterium]